MLSMFWVFCVCVFQGHKSHHLFFLKSHTILLINHKNVINRKGFHGEKSKSTSYRLTNEIEKTKLNNRKGRRNANVDRRLGEGETEMGIWVKCESMAEASL